METKTKLALIYSSTREGRFADVIGNWAKRTIEKDDRFELTIIDPKISEPVEAVGKRLEQADAFLILVPEYNHSFPAPLKAIIDSYYTPWRVKPIGFISYGGISGGIRAVEQLRQIFVEMHGVSIPAGVILPNAWSLFDSNKELINPAPTEKSLLKVLNQLKWWSRILKPARESKVNPYSEAIG